MDLLLDRERIALAKRGLIRAREELALDLEVQQVIAGWLAHMDRDEICADFAMPLAIYNAARKRALRETRKHAPSCFARS